MMKINKRMFMHSFLLCRAVQRTNTVDDKGRTLGGTEWVICRSKTGARSGKPIGSVEGARQGKGGEVADDVSSVMPRECVVYGEGDVITSRVSSTMTTRSGLV